jgi:hypothetical protein
MLNDGGLRQGGLFLTQYNFGTWMTEAPYFLPGGEFGIAALAGQPVAGVFTLYALGVPQPVGVQAAFPIYLFNTNTFTWSTLPGSGSGSPYNYWRGVTMAPSGTLAVPSFTPTPAATLPFSAVYPVRPTFIGLNLGLSSRISAFLRAAIRKRVANRGLCGIL